MQSIPKPSDAMESTPPASDPSPWHVAQLAELNFWGKCENTWGEEAKQLVYMRKMGFINVSSWRSPVGFDAWGKTFLDVGGGPVSVLLKMINLKRGKVIDPCPYPSWVIDRYKASGIEYEQIPGEDMTDVGFDVGLIYNCLQHVLDPEKLVHNLRKAAGEVHIFEWIDTPTDQAHPHCLRASDLEKWLGRPGYIEQLNGENGCSGKAWYL